MIFFSEHLQLILLRKNAKEIEKKQKLKILNIIKCLRMLLKESNRYYLPIVYIKIIYIFLQNIHLFLLRWLLLTRVWTRSLPISSKLRIRILPCLIMWLKWTAKWRVRKKLLPNLGTYNFTKFFQKNWFNNDGTISRIFLIGSILRRPKDVVTNEKDNKETNLIQWNEGLRYP